MPVRKTFDVGSYLGFNSDLYVFDDLAAKAKWRYKLRLHGAAIRYISFANEYLNSLKLVTRFKKTVKG